MTNSKETLTPLERVLQPSKIEGCRRTVLVEEDFPSLVRDIYQFFKTELFRTSSLVDRLCQLAEQTGDLQAAVLLVESQPSCLSPEMVSEKEPSVAWLIGKIFQTMYQEEVNNLLEKIKTGEDSVRQLIEETGQNDNLEGDLAESLVEKLKEHKAGNDFLEIRAGYCQEKRVLREFYDFLERLAQNQVDFKRVEDFILSNPNLEEIRNYWGYVLSRPGKNKAITPSLFVPKELNDLYLLARVITELIEWQRGSKAFAYKDRILEKWPIGDPYSPSSCIFVGRLVSVEYNKEQNQYYLRLSGAGGSFNSRDPEQPVREMAELLGKTEDLITYYNYLIVNFAAPPLINLTDSVELDLQPVFVFLGKAGLLANEEEKKEFLEKIRTKKEKVYVFQKRGFSIELDFSPSVYSILDPNKVILKYPSHTIQAIERNKDNPGIVEIHKEVWVRVGLFLEDKNLSLEEKETAWRPIIQAIKDLGLAFF